MATKPNKQRKISSVFAVDRETGNVLSAMRMAPSLAILLISEGRAQLTEPNDPNCNTVYLLADSPTEKQAISAMFGAAIDPLRGGRMYRMVGSLEDFVIESSDVDCDYAMPVLPTIGYDRTTHGYDSVASKAA
jgi:hypothetical protein